MKNIAKTYSLSNTSMTDEEIFLNQMIDRTFKSLKYDLESIEDKLGEGFELTEALESLEDAVTTAKRKQREMNLLSFYAFNSNHEMLSKQRRELFLSTSMLYSKEIAEILDSLDEYSDNLDPPCESASEAIDNNNKSNIIDYFYTWNKKLKLISKIVWSKNV